MSKRIESGMLIGRLFGGVVTLINNGLRKITKRFTVTNSLNNEIQLKNNLFRLKLTFRPRRRPSSERFV